MTYYGPKEMAASFRTVRANTIKIAEEIPEEKYDFRAAPGCRSVAETLVHIAVGTRLQEQIHITEHLDTLVGFDFFGFMGKQAAEEKATRSKAEILELLRTSGENVRQVVGRSFRLSAVGERAIPAGDGAADQITLRNDALAQRA